jgi:hypothetical protein
VQNTAGWIYLLPYIEQAPLYQQYNFNLTSSLSSPCGYPVAGPSNANPNVAVTSAALAALVCPSHPQGGEISTSNPTTPSQYYSRENARRTSYGFATGGHTDYSNLYTATNADIRQGAFGNSGAARIQDITDGTTNTVAIGEAWSGGRYKVSGEYGPWGMTGTHTCCHLYTPSNSSTVLDLAQISVVNGTSTIVGNYRINAAYNNDAQKRQYAWGYGSGHTGGCQVTLCDGSVRFISENIDALTFWRLTYIHDGQVIGEF